MSAKLMTISEAAELLDVSTAEIFRMLESGELSETTNIDGADSPVILESAVMRLYMEQHDRAKTRALGPAVMAARSAFTARERAADVAAQRCIDVGEPERFCRFLAEEQRRLGISGREPAAPAEPRAASPAVSCDDLRVLASAQATTRCLDERKPQMFARYFDEALQRLGVAVEGVGVKMFGAPVGGEASVVDLDRRWAVSGRAAARCRAEQKPEMYGSYLAEEQERDLRRSA